MRGSDRAPGLVWLGSVLALLQGVGLFFARFVGRNVSSTGWIRTIERLGTGFMGEAARMTGGTEVRMRWALAAVLFVGAVLAVGSGVLWNLRQGLGVALGSLLAAGNLWVLARVLRALLVEGGPTARSAPWLLLALVKLFALFAAFYLLVIGGIADILALAIGYGALPIGIVISQVGASGEDTEG